MNTETQNKIAEYYAKLPEKAQVMFSDMKWMEVLKNVSELHKFSQAQNEILGTETTLVLLGIISLEEYQDVLENELKLDKDLFKKVFREIEEQIIRPVRTDLIQAHNQNKTDLVEEKYGPKLDERFSKLSPEIRSAIESTNYQKTIVDIGAKEKLTTDQLGKLEEEVTKIMLGTENQLAFRSNLREKLGLNEEKTSAIITAVNGHIFAPIRDFFKEEVMSESIVRPITPLNDALNKTEEAEHVVDLESSSMPKEDIDMLSKVGIRDIKNKESKAETIEVLDRDDLLVTLENPRKTFEEVSKQSAVSTEAPTQAKEEFLTNETVLSELNSELEPKGITQPKQENTPVVEEKSPVQQTPTTPSFLANKLGEKTASTSKITDHSLPTMSTAPIDSIVPAKKADPYLEPLE